jgi:hypothetical protein
MSWEIVIAFIGLVALLVGFVGWWALSGRLTRREKIADALHRYKRDVNRASYHTMMDLSRVRREYGGNER